MVEAVLTRQSMKVINETTAEDHDHFSDCFGQLLISKLTIKCLHLKQAITKIGVENLMERANVLSIHIHMPISCPPSLISSLQLITKDIVFVFSSERVRKFNLELNGFVKFRHLPIIKVQYEVDEKSVNKIIKQWINAKRPNFEGFYAQRRGKMDKLDILQKDFEIYTSEAQVGSMATFFNVCIPGRPNLAVTYSSMCFVVETPRVPEKPIVSGLMNLNMDIELAILKQLPYKDYFNLALTCRKWYQRASTAPESVKPSLTYNHMTVFNGIIIGYQDVRADAPSLCFNANLKFNMIRQIECKIFRLMIDTNQKVGQQFVDSCKFLIEHRERFKFSQLVVLYPTHLEKDESLMLEFYSLFTNLAIDTGVDKFNLVIQDKQLYESAFTLFQHSLHFRTIMIHYPIELSVICEVLKQWVRKERPNMELLRCSFKSIGGTNQAVLKKLLRAPVKKFVAGTSSHGKARLASVVVPGLPPLIVICENGFVILRPDCETTAV